MVNPPPAEPHCTLTPLEFSMWAMEHLEGMQGRRGLVAPPEKSVLSEVDMRLEVLGSLVHHALNKVRQEVWWVGLMLVTPSLSLSPHPHHPHHLTLIILLNIAYRVPVLFLWRSGTVGIGLAGDDTFIQA